MKLFLVPLVACALALPALPGGASEAPEPAKSRLVGIGHAAIEVPASWGTNAAWCGTPQRDTVVFDTGPTTKCFVPRPAGVESLELWSGIPFRDFGAPAEIVIDGVPAQQQDTTCRTRQGGKLCVGTVYVPKHDVTFLAVSSTGAEAVNEVLGWIRVVPGKIGVPGYRSLSVPNQDDGLKEYLASLKKAGLTARIERVKIPATPADRIRRVSPEPGTMRTPGSVVTVTVTAPPDGPADEVEVGMNSLNSAGSRHRDLEDEQIRAGATIRLDVGSRIWAYATGKRAGTLAGGLTGKALKIDTAGKKGPNYPNIWVATKPGRSKVTLSIQAKGKRIVLGVVTVVVRKAGT